MIQEPKFLGGYMEQTHLVKGKAEICMYSPKFVKKNRKKIRKKDSSNISTNDSNFWEEIWSILTWSKVRLKIGFIKKQD